MPRGNEKEPSALAGGGSRFGYGSRGFYRLGKPPRVMFEHYTPPRLVSTSVQTRREGRR